MTFTARELNPHNRAGPLGIRDLAAVEIERVTDELGGGEWIRTSASDWAALPTVTCGLFARWFRLFPLSVAHFRSATDRVGVEIHSLRQVQHRAGVEMRLAH